MACPDQDDVWLSYPAVSGEANLIPHDCGTELALDSRAILNGFFVHGVNVKEITKRFRIFDLSSFGR